MNLNIHRKLSYHRHGMFLNVKCRKMPVQNVQCSSILFMYARRMATTRKMISWHLNELRNMMSYSNVCLVPGVHIHVLLILENTTIQRFFLCACVCVRIKSFINGNNHIIDVISKWKMFRKCFGWMCVVWRTNSCSVAVHWMKRTRQMLILFFYLDFFLV